MSDVTSSTPETGIISSNKKDTVFISNINYHIMDSINEKKESKGERHLTTLGYVDCILYISLF